MDRLEEAREALRQVVEDERVAGKPLLVFANKQDKEGALDENEIRNRLGIGQTEKREGGREERTEEECSINTRLSNVVSVKHSPS